ncbi:hypothetical protein JKP88DRAFT_265443 [Tribonema minus]|uniref:AN1-type domain-containing protein n=1 Tax=Tribonema minus TaxID=303371 RepID=A0A836C9G4_9STRA|nr:hypothetical protein JKP88DRAFT_265443 [Tribonema minus]
MAEFTEIGQRCSAPLCNLKDFLPFDCDCCQQVFCLNHRSYASHECPLSGTKNMTAIVCPLCKSTIRLSDAQDANAEWERHARTSCSPEKAAKKARKRCNADGCREVLGLSNSHTCAQCHAAVCLTHRFAESHNCARGFADAVELVSHVEGEHNGGAGLTATSTSTGGYDYGKCVMA